jgi:hypothetical protein
MEAVIQRFSIPTGIITTGLCGTGSAIPASFTAFRIAF